MNYEDRVYLITGSTSGIGQGIAKKLLEKGAKVVVNYAHNEDNAQATKKLFKEYDDKVLYIKADVSNENDIKKMFENIKNKWGRLDGLINNAVYNTDNYIEDVILDEYKKELEVNVIARWLCIKYAVALLKESDVPRIINIASRLGTKPMEASVTYCTSEAATIMLTKCCAIELTPKYNIKINTISPSLTLTPFSIKNYTEEAIKETAQNNPSKRLGKISDVVNTALFLLSDDADYINGENINVNGGILLK